VATLRCKILTDAAVADLRADHLAEARAEFNIAWEIVALEIARKVAVIGTKQMADEQ
jgi:hypothetical protein